MACSCGAGKKNSAAAQTSKTYVHTDPQGTQRTYKSEVEAAAATKRLGGAYRPA
jgi:hypothetical protein